METLNPVLIYCGAELVPAFNGVCSRCGKQVRTVG